jgi:predicted alpha/beta-hydrolase family hydrolase
MLFVQGTRDALAERGLLEALMVRLGARASLSLIEDADHSFHLPARTGKDSQVRSELLRAVARWMESSL